MSMEGLSELVEMHRQKLDRWYDDERARLESRRRECIKDCDLLAMWSSSHRKCLDSHMDLPAVASLELMYEADLREAANDTSSRGLVDVFAGVDFPDALQQLATQRRTTCEGNDQHGSGPPGTIFEDNDICFGNKGTRFSLQVETQVDGVQKSLSSGRDVVVDSPLVVGSVTSSPRSNLTLPSHEYGRAQATPASIPKARVSKLRAVRELRSERKLPGLAAMVSGNCLQAMNITMIVLNSLFLVFSTEDMLTSSIEGKVENSIWQTFELIFCIFFFTELLWRLYTDRRHFCDPRERWLNALDALLVGLSTMDVILNLSKAGHMMNVTFARPLRFLRFVQVLRIMRVMSLFHSFRLMIYSIMYSMLSLVWVFAMLAFVMYLFSMVFMHGIAEHFRAARGSGGPCETATCEELTRLFGNATLTLVSLFMSITGGLDWSELWLLLRTVHWIYSWLFLFYVFFMVFGVLNIVVATFVDSVSVISKRDRDLVTYNELEKNRQCYADIKRFFNEADTNKSGSLTWEEFKDYLQDENVQAYFQSFQLDVTQAKTLFLLLDSNGSNDVNIEEFVEGCMRMRGLARSIDVNQLLYESQQVMRRQAEFMQYIEAQLMELKSQAGDKR